MKRVAILVTAALAMGVPIAMRERLPTPPWLVRQSGEARELEWPDLVPAKDFEDPFDALSPGQFADIANVDLVRQLQERERMPTATSIRLAKESRQRLTAAGVDVDSLLARKNEIAKKYDKWARSVKSDLNGQTIEIGGYMLPLEYAGTKVTEFLLVPYLGACIHVPPPPPNQIVHVKLTEGIETKGLYEPVAVAGVLSTRRSSPELSYVDGVASVDTSYRLDARQVTSLQQ